jgi:hypothetical protein
VSSRGRGSSACTRRRRGTCRISEGCEGGRGGAHACRGGRVGPLWLWVAGRRLSVNVSPWLLLMIHHTIHTEVGMWTNVLLLIGLLCLPAEVELGHSRGALRSAALRASHDSLLAVAVVCVRCVGPHATPRSTQDHARTGYAVHAAGTRYAAVVRCARSPVPLSLFKKALLTFDIDA